MPKHHTSKAMMVFNPKKSADKQCCQQTGMGKSWNAVFVKVHELPPSSPRIPPHPRWVNIQAAPTPVRTEIYCP
jgi:hypothetical protein